MPPQEMGGNSDSRGSENIGSEGAVARGYTARADTAAHAESLVGRVADVVALPTPLVFVQYRHTRS
jgi:hypothetical protein